MRSLIEMYRVLIDNVKSHTFDIEGNSIIAKRKIKSRSFSSFKITYLKNGEISYKSTSYDSFTLRFSNDQDMFCLSGSVSDLSIDYTINWNELKRRLDNPEEQVKSIERINSGLAHLGLLI
jgi:hypothetical protein